METRSKIKNQKLLEEQNTRKKQEMNLRKTMFKRKHNFIRRNDMIVNRSLNKIKLEPNEDSNIVKQEVCEEGDDDVEVEVVSVLKVVEKVDLSDDASPCISSSNEGRVSEQMVAGDGEHDARIQECSTEESNATEATSELISVPEAATLIHAVGLSTENNASIAPLPEKVNELDDVVGRPLTELKEVNEMLAKCSPVTSAPQPSINCEISCQDDPANTEASQNGDNEMATESPLSTVTVDESNEGGSSGCRLMNCLICYQPISSSTNEDHGIPELDKQLNSIFILDKLLCLPTTYLTKFLKLCPGRNPHSWIRLCDECGNNVRVARKSYEQMLESSRKYKRIQKTLVEKVNFSNRNSDQNRNKGHQKIEELVAQETRKFVTEYDYGFATEPFSQQDLESVPRLVEEARTQMTANNAGKSNRRQRSEFDEVNSVKPSSGNCRHTRSKAMQADFRKSVGETNTENNSSVITPRKTIYRKPFVDGRCIIFCQDGKLCYRCQFGSCSKVFRSKHNYLLHKLQHSGERPTFTCSQCRRVYKSYSGLFLHKKIIHEKDLTRHQSQYKRRQQLQRKCSRCDMISDKYSLARHMKVVHERAFQVKCSICGNTYSCPQNLIKHEAQIHGICSVKGCRQQFPGNRSELWIHQLQVHRKEINVFSCKKCGNLFSSAHALRIHRQRKLH